MRLWQPLRVVILLLGVLWLTDPMVQQGQKSLDLWLVVDRSESADQLSGPSVQEWVKILEQKKPSRHDKLHLIQYGEEVELHLAGSDRQSYTGKKNLTKTALALENVLALADPERANRVLLMTDGYATESITNVASKLQLAEIPLDYRMLGKEFPNDFQLAKLSLPDKVQVNEPYVIEIIVRGEQNLAVPLELKRNGQTIAKSDVEVKDGFAVVEFTDRIATAGSYQYSAGIYPPNDQQTGNNQKDKWIEIAGGPRVLLISQYTNDPLVQSLEKLAYDVELVTNATTLNAGALSGAKTVIINNVPANKIATPFLAALDFYVREQGGGLMMVGGKHAFGSGGYYQSDIDALLPVSMELKSDHHKLEVAMAVVMDRSGSMAMRVAGGTKMDLANRGATTAVELLGDRDQICVFAVDSEAHRMVPLTRMAGNRDDITKRIRRIRSEGGGIYTYNGLYAGWLELKKSKAGTRHLILFSDAADSEQPSKYKQLIEEMRAADVTISVIGLGTDKDSDAWLLKDIAKRGDGRIFFTEDAKTIPQLFAQETVSVARSTFLEDPVSTLSTGKWFELTGSQLSWLEQVDGYNLSYLRPEASAMLISQDEYAAPLVSYVRRGMGRCVATSFPLAGEFSASALGWNEYGDFTQTLTRWLMGDELPPGIAVRQQAQGTDLQLDLLYDQDSWERELANNPPRIMVIEDDQPPAEIIWQRMAPGHYQIRHQASEGSTLRGAIQLGQRALSFGPVTMGTSSEWAFDKQARDELVAASELSGGRDLLDLSDAWLRPEISQLDNLRLPLAIAVLLILLLDALLTRIGWQWNELASWMKSWRKKPALAAAPAEAKKSSWLARITQRPTIAKTSKKPRAAEKPKESPVDKEETPVTASSRQSRYARAKKRK